MEFANAIALQLFTSDKSPDLHLTSGIIVDWQKKYLVHNHALKEIKQNAQIKLKPLTTI